MQNRVAEYLGADPEMDPGQILDRYVGDERAHSWRAGVALGFILGAVAGVLAAVLFWPRGADAMPSKLVFTVPDRGQHCYKILGEEGDSVTVCECVGTLPVRQVTKAYLWGARITGGGFQLVDSITYLPTDSVEGLLDTFPVPFAGNFYVKFANPVGLGCESNVVAVLPDVTTDVEPEPKPVQAGFPPVKPTWHDVSGRRVELPRGTGIFFQQVTGADRKVWARRVFVRSSRPYSFGRWVRQ